MGAWDGTCLVDRWGLEAYKFFGEETTTGKITTTFGKHPRGHIIFTPGGHVMALGVGSDRVSLSATDPTDSERAALFKTLFAYSGSYRLEGKNLVHDVQVSWNGT